jgi:hypothetical protein
MADEGCPNESTSVEDATGYSIEKEEVEAMAGERHEGTTGKLPQVSSGCAYCPHEVTYIIDFSRSVNSPEKRIALKAAFLNSQEKPA